MATSLDLTALDLTTPAGCRDAARRCDAWAVSKRARGGLDDLRAAERYEAVAAGARWVAAELEAGRLAPEGDV